MTPEETQKTESKNSKIGYPFLIVFTLFFLGMGYFISSRYNKVEKLPFLGECRYDTVKKDGSFMIDSVHHIVKNFSFIDQTGKTITENDFKGKLYVTNFFFTTCVSICPVMNNQMQRVAEAYKNEPNVLFLSHTVYPENDSVSVLAAYAETQNADASRWHFVTGSKKAIYDMARTSYLLSADSGDGGIDDFVHTQKLALVDTDRHVRGIYDGLNPKDVDRLIGDIAILLKK